MRTLPGRNGRALALDDLAGVLYVASTYDGLLKIDVASGDLLDSHPTPPWDSYASFLTLDEGGARLIGPERNGYLTEIDTSTLDEVGVIGPTGLSQTDADDASDRLVAVSPGVCCNGSGDLVEFAPTVPPVVLPTAGDNEHSDRR